MKPIKLFSVILVTSAAFIACNNDASNKTTAGNADTGTTTISSTDPNTSRQNLETSNKQLVTGFIQSLYGDKDSTAIDKYIADNIKQHNPILQDGKPWLKNFLHGFLTNPNIRKSKVDIKQSAADGDKVWVHIRDVAPNGKVFSRVEIFRVENGKIAENWLINEPEPKTSENKNGIF